jgi:hypothetical protein
MYRQIQVHPEDRSFQRLFWRVNGRIQVFELNTVTFGVTTAPFLAIRTINRLADDEGAQFPAAAQILKQDVYVDDLLTGADSLQESITIRDDIIEILKRGGFQYKAMGVKSQGCAQSIKGGNYEFRFVSRTWLSFKTAWG